MAKIPRKALENTANRNNWRTYHIRRQARQDIADENAPPMGDMISRNWVLERRRLWRLPWFGWTNKMDNSHILSKPVNDEIKCYAMRRSQVPYCLLFICRPVRIGRGSSHIINERQSSTYILSSPVCEIGIEQTLVSTWCTNIHFKLLY